MSEFTKQVDSYDFGNSVVRVRGQAMYRDDSSGGWVPMGGGGLSNVSVRRRKVHHNENDEPCKHEYLIHGQRITDQAVILTCTIKRDFEYNKVMPTFHHWKTGNKRYGLTFHTAADARAFDKGVSFAIDDVLDEMSNPSPLHQEVKSEVGDDDVFMQLNLPVEKRPATADSDLIIGSTDHIRSPSPLDDPVDHYSSAWSGCSPVKSRLSPSGLKLVSASPTPSSSVDSGELMTLLKPSPVSSSGAGHPLQTSFDHHQASQRMDVDYSYVQFLNTPSSVSHDYSYPKLVDCTRVGSTTTTTATQNASRNTNFIPQSTQFERPKPTLKDSTPPVRSFFRKSSQRSEDKKGLNRHNNNGSRYKFRFRRKKKSDSGDGGDVDSSKGDNFLMCDHKSSSTAGSDISFSSAVAYAFEDGEVASRVVFKRPGAGVSNVGASNEGVSEANAAGMPSELSDICAHCRKSFVATSNRRGDCQYAPDRLRNCIETVTCLACAKCVHYHCLADAEDQDVHPCSCSNVDGHFGIRWVGLSLLSILIPCLCLYPPLIGCYKCGQHCHACGGVHQCEDNPRPP